MSTRIFIVEDAAKIALVLEDYLKQNGYETEICGDGGLALEAFGRFKPDLILLDVMLPNLDGVSILKAIRAGFDTPVIMVTARVDEVDRLIGLELGADDYVCKPFSPREVVARVKALLRRVSKQGSDNANLLALNESRLTLDYQGQSVQLSTVEFQLIQRLHSQPGRIFSRQSLMQAIYSDHRVVNDRTIDSHIKKLRRKWEESFSEVGLIRSIYGAGYTFEFVEKE